MGCADCFSFFSPSYSSFSISLFQQKKTCGGHLGQPGHRRQGNLVAIHGCRLLQYVLCFYSIDFLQYIIHTFIL
jgi:hypothetical protein